MKRTVAAAIALLAVLAGCEAGFLPPTIAPTPTATPSPVASPSPTAATSPAPSAPEPTVGLVLHGATAITPEGKMTYTGLTDFKPGFPVLTEFKEAGDFEAVSEWVAGLTGPSCHRVFVLKNPTRLVIDLQHPQG